MDEQEMGNQTPARARDENDNIIKVEKAPNWEVIDPWVYKKLGRAVNYDLTFQPSTKLGNTIGAWTSRPFNRPGYGPTMEQYLRELKDEGKVKWELRAFLFTHAQGIAARKHYVEQVLRGKIRATTSWGPNPERDEDKSRFHKLVPRVLAEELGFEYKENDTDTYFGKVDEDNFVSKDYFKANDLVIVTIEQLRDRYQEMYKAKTQAYIKKSDKLEAIKKAMEQLSDQGEEEITSELIAHTISMSWATKEAVAKLMDDEITEAKTKKETITEVEEPTLSFDDAGEPSPEQIEESVNAEVVEELTDELEHTEDYEDEEAVIAAVTATEEPVEVEQSKAVREIVNTDNCYKQDKPHKLRVFTDAKLMNVSSTDYEGIMLDGETPYYFIEDKSIAGGEQQVLAVGRHVIGDEKTGLTHLFEVYKVKV